MTYNLQTLRGDVFGGVTAGVVALPLALAFGVASGLGPIAGMYSAIAVGFFAAMFGGTRVQISGPTAPMTVAMGAIVAQYAHSLPEAFTVVILAGLMQVFLGTLRVGRFVAYTPYSVISGFMSGIGVIIIVVQVLPFFGAPVTSGGVMGTLRALPEALLGFNAQAFAIGALTLGVAIMWPRRLNRAVPQTLVALLVGTTASILWMDGVPVIGQVPSGLPALQTPVLSLDFLLHALEPAFILALLGSIDSLLTSLVSDSLTRTSHNGDRELVGQGVGNMVAGLIGALPGAGTTLTTVTNVRAGGRTPVAGLLVAAMLLTLVLGFGWVAEPIPHAALAGILIRIGWDIVDWRFFRHIRDIGRDHLAVMLLTLVLTLFVDLVAAVAIGLIVAGMANAHRMQRLELDNVISVPLLEGDVSDPYLARIGLVALRGRFSVASSSALANTIGKDIEDHKVVIFDFSKTIAMDDSAVMVIEQLIKAAEEQDTQCVVMGLSGTVASALNGLGALDAVPKQNFTAGLESAKALARRLLEGERSA